jgi:hypothetical protein
MIASPTSFECGLCDAVIWRADRTEHDWWASAVAHFREMHPDAVTRVPEPKEERDDR